MGGRVGTYTLLEVVGTGGSGMVWRARSARGEPVAVKLLATAVASDERHRRAFRREIAGVARLDHPSVISVLDAGVVPDDTPAAAAGSPWLAMELAESTLAAAPPRRWNEVLTVLVTLLDVLAHAHARGLVHRDLKPGNVLRTTAG